MNKAFLRVYTLWSQNTFWLHRILADISIAIFRLYTLWSWDTSWLRSILADIGLAILRVYILRSRDGHLQDTCWLTKILADIRVAVLLTCYQHPPLLGSTVCASYKQWNLNVRYQEVPSRLPLMTVNNLVHLERVTTIPVDIGTESISKYAIRLIRAYMHDSLGRLLVPDVN